MVRDNYVSNINTLIIIFLKYFLSSINVILYFYFFNFFREPMPVESPSFSPNPGGVCGGGRAGGCASARRVCE